MTPRHFLHNILMWHPVHLASIISYTVKHLLGFETFAWFFLWEESPWLELPECTKSPLVEAQSQIERANSRILCLHTYCGIWILVFPSMGQRVAKEMEQYIQSVQYIKEWHESDAKMTPRVLRLYPIPFAYIKQTLWVFSIVSETQ